MQPLTPTVRENRRGARRAGLRYATDTDPGIERKTAGRRTYYVDAKGKRVRGRATLARIRALAIPPAWTDVWIAPHAHDHLQARGRDARGRKQYRYHERWRASRDETKYVNLVAFAKVLPRIRRRVERHLKRRGLPRERYSRPWCDFWKRLSFASGTRSTYAKTIRSG